MESVESLKAQAAKRKYDAGGPPSGKITAAMQEAALHAQVKTAPPPPGPF